MSDGNRRIVAVVMGGTSGGARDNQMAELIRQYLPKASTQGGTPPLVAPIAAIAQVILPKRNPPMPDRRPKAEVVVATDEDQVIAAEEAQIAAQPPVEEVVETSSERVMQAYAEPMRRPKAAIDGLKAAAGQPSGWPAAAFGSVDGGFRPAPLGVGLHHGLGAGLDHLSHRRLAAICASSAAIADLRRSPSWPRAARPASAGCAWAAPGRSPR